MDVGIYKYKQPFFARASRGFARGCRTKNLVTLRCHQTWTIPQWTSARSQCRPGAKCLRFLFKASSQAGPRKSQSHLPQAMRKVYQNMGAMRTIYVVVIIYPRQ